ncbi:5'-3' exonuclease [Linum perenne]
MEVAVPAPVHLHAIKLSPAISLYSVHLRTAKNLSKRTSEVRARARLDSASPSTPCSTPGGAICRTVGGQSLKNRRVFFLDVNPLCYHQGKPSVDAFGHWISLFFSQVSLTDPVIAVFDGEGGSRHRRQLLPSYKEHRMKFLVDPLSPRSQKYSKDRVERAQLVMDVLAKCNVPIVKVEGQEADDVVATLAQQALTKGYKVVIASPDKDFKQLISDDVQIVQPIIELKRWSFYTLRHYLAQYNCDPCSDLSFRCIVGDEVDGVPGLQSVAPSFGRKTALKLLKKHGSLENLLNAAAVRTVGKPYIQDALIQHADYLRKNYQVLALKKDVDVLLQDDWLVQRDQCHDSGVLADFFKVLAQKRRGYSKK